MRRGAPLLALTIVLFASAPAAFAQQPETPPRLDLSVLASLPPAAAPGDGPQGLAANSLSRPDTSSRPRKLIPLFASYAALQALDVHSTLRIVNRGGSEQSPLVGPLVSRPAAFIAFKAGLATTTLVASDWLSKRNRLAAYAVMFGLNSAYAIVVVHNYQVAGTLRQR